MGDMGDFLQQIPAPLILNVCIAGSMFIALVVYFSYIKPARRKRLTEQEKMESLGSVSNPVLYGDEELPDLDMLTIDEPELEPDELETLLPSEPIVTPQPVAQTAQPIPTRKGEQVVRLASGGLAQALPVLSILRDTEDDRLIIQLDEKAYRTLVDQPDVKQRFTSLMKELAETIAKPDARPVETAPEVQAQPQPKPAYTPPKPVVPPPPANDGRMPGDLPKYTDIKETPKRGILGMPKYEAPPIPELNIAAAIESYLQHKLRYTPEYAHRVIHIHSAPGGGVRIEVDGQFYEAVGDITDSEARTFISETIQEWQERQ